MSVPIIEARLGWAIACSRLGASHARSGKPCQDAYAIWSGCEGGEPCLAVAVADGHGDERHDLSQHGAALAVQVAVNELRAFHQNFGNQGLSASLPSSFKADFPRRVHKQWRAAILEDAARRVGLAHVDSQEIFSRYGTTLLAALVAPDLILLGQIGDGDLLVLHGAGNVDAPLPKDDSLVGNETYSLACPDAPNLWQTTTLERRSASFLLLGTDGLSNSFVDTRQFHTFARSLTDRVYEFGLEGVSEALPYWLDLYSEKGSGDDITLALVALASAKSVERAGLAP